MIDILFKITFCVLALSFAFLIVVVAIMIMRDLW